MYLFWQIHLSIWKTIFFYFDKFIFQFGGRENDAGENG